MLSSTSGNGFQQATALDPAQLRRGQSLGGYIHDRNPHQFYTLTVRQPSRFSAQLGDLTADADLRLLDSQGKLLQGSYRGGQEADYVEQELIPGTYYLQVSEFYGNTRYQLTVQLRALLADVLANPTDLTPQVGVKPRSAQLEIDAFLNSDSSYWDTTASQGAITYSFYNAAAGEYSGAEQVSEVSASIQANVRQILSQLETLIPVQFVEVPDNAASHGALRYMFSDAEGQTGFYAYSYYPGEGVGGDVHLNARWESDPVGRFSGAAGSYGYTTLMHETLHALGLKHPGNYDHGGAVPGGPFLPADQDHKSHSIMSYNGLGTGASTPLAYDIRALQYLYGTVAYADRDSRYQFSTDPFSAVTTRTNQAIRDTGGIDTIDLSAITNRPQNYYVDLRPGGIVTTQAAVKGGRYFDYGTGQMLTAPEYGTMIAFDTVIENFITGSGDDYVMANAAQNCFGGYDRIAGNDVIENADGNDILDLGGNRRGQLQMTMLGQDLLVGLGERGTIRVRNYFVNDNPPKILVDGVKYVYQALGEWLLAS